MYKIDYFPSGMLEVNCITIVNESSGEFIVIDPGGVEEPLNKLLNDTDKTLKGLIHTHAHFDHILGAIQILSSLTEDNIQDIAVGLHFRDLPLWENPESQAARFGISCPSNNFSITLDFEKNTEISLAGINLKILHTPGHSPGSVSLYFPDKNILFSGDTIFNGSIGRTDLWEGNYETLIHSIKNRIFTLPEDTVIIPGHGPETSVGHELRNNPFFK